MTLIHFVLQGLKIQVKFFKSVAVPDITVATTHLRHTQSWERGE